MDYRTVVMYIEISCFIFCISGWILISATLPTDIWTWSELSSVVLTTSNYYSNLWQDCVSDSTGTSDCKPIASFFGLNWDIHMCRALIITGIILGFFGTVLVLVGMKCTKLGGSEIINAKVTFAGGINYFVAGLLSMVAFSYYGNQLRSRFEDPSYRLQKYEIGVGVYLGWGGSTLLVIGGLIYSIFAGKEGCNSSSKRTDVRVNQLPDANTAMVSKINKSQAPTEKSKSIQSKGSNGSTVSDISTKTSTVNEYV